MVGAEPDARGSPNDADVLSRFWFSSRSHSGSLSFHLRVGWPWAHLFQMALARLRCIPHPT